MRCTYANCPHPVTREVTWLVLGLPIGPFTHPYCEAHAQRLNATVHVLYERVLEIAR